MDFQPIEFTDVPYGSLSEAPCAPRIPDRRYRGIVIRAPDHVGVREGETIKLPICGAYQLPTLPLVQGAVMRVHVRGIGGTQVPPMVGQVVIDQGENEPDMPDPADKEPIDPKLFAHKVSESYFYLDGQRYLKRALPPGRYEVFVSYGPAQSNVVRVEIQPR